MTERSRYPSPVPSASSEDETSAKSASPASPPSSSSSKEDLLIESGAVVAGRYRVIRRVGRGGMGDVYLVQDLTLDQEVALKFLPGALSQDSVRLSLFHNEVRMARRVTHRNVCRIYDIGEVDGQVFLSMEYVDGEDLASLLRRIGRLPEDKGLQIARQLCAGLAAAHDEGVVHRDLKPANVMIDSRGEVRITDFGLAGIASEIRDVGSGTPAYMAPEQLRGQEVSSRSDIYSLGLILYEVFTGRRAFDATSMRERLEAQDRSDFTMPTSAVRELSPATESALCKCLSPRSGDRPGSALEVAAMLPGGDPLADALAAGKTPSPELVAAAGGHSALAPKWALSGLAGVLLGCLVFVVARTPNVLIQHVSISKPPEVLVDRATSLVEALGLPGSLNGQAFGFAPDEDYMRLVIETEPSPDRWQGLGEVRPGVLQFWFRSSPERLVPVELDARVGPRDPPWTLPGMVNMIMDSEGNLVELVVVPEPLASSGARPRVDWSYWFEAAGVGSFTSWTVVPPERTPAVFADRRHAWRGTLPGWSEPGRVEAATLDGALVSFRVVRPGERPEITGMPTGAVRRAVGVIASLVVVSILVGSVLLARRNLKLGRGDRQGASRVAAVVFVLSLLPSVGAIQHYADPNLELNRVVQAMMVSAFPAAIFWLIYVALEPYVRRLWPHGLIAWNRLLAGGVRDPLVGRDVLVGMLAGVLMALSVPLRTWLAIRLGIASAPPASLGLLALQGNWFQILSMLRDVLSSFNNAMVLVFLFVVLRFFFKRQWMAAIATGATFGLLIGGEIGNAPGATLLNAANAFLFIVIMVGVMVRFGLLSVVVAGAVDLILRTTSLTLDLDRWYAGPTWTTLFAIGAMAIYAFTASRSGEPLLGARWAPD